MNAEPVSPPDARATRHARVEEILNVFAQEARIERSALRLDARADELGATSLDLALAMFELEARFGVSLPEPAPGDPLPTVGEMVQQVLDAQRSAVASGLDAGPDSASTPTSGTDAGGTSASGA